MIERLCIFLIRILVVALAFAPITISRESKQRPSVAHQQAPQEAPAQQQKL